MQMIVIIPNAVHACIITHLRPCYSERTIMQAKVLIIGYDGTLLHTREILIEQAGYRFQRRLAWRH
jgi:hypothetical protein